MSTVRNTFKIVPLLTSLCLFCFSYFFFQLANKEFFQALNDRRVFQTDMTTYSIEELVTVASEHTPKNSVRNSVALKSSSLAISLSILSLCTFFK